jgi:hypothetical protein
MKNLAPNNNGNNISSSVVVGQQHGGGVGAMTTTTAVARMPTIVTAVSFVLASRLVCFCFRENESDKLIFVSCDNDDVYIFFYII